MITSANARPSSITKLPLYIWQRSFLKNAKPNKLDGLTLILGPLQTILNLQITLKKAENLFTSMVMRLKATLISIKSSGNLHKHTLTKIMRQYYTLNS